LTLALVHLVAAERLTGYLSALRKTWSALDLELVDMPVKSSLSEARSEISYQFFQESLRDQVRAIQSKLPRIRGYRVYAVDGDQLELPASEDILRAGYRGFPCKDDRETHFPRMYYTAKVEVFSGIAVDVRQSERNDECKNAVEMAAEATSDSITLYDRLHFSLELAQAHEASKSRYIARLKTGSRVLRELQGFIASKRKAKRLEIGGIHIRFLRVKNPETGEWMYLATNLPRGVFKIREIQWLYWRRYDIETVFRDLTATHSLGVWHSFKINGVLQEFYLQFYVHNASRFLILTTGGIEVIKDLKKGEYRRPNFKLIREYFVDNLKLLIQKRMKQFTRDIHSLIEKSRELRIYFARLSPRQVKSTRNMYASASLVDRRT
jgi:hypothetical protein